MDYLKDKRRYWNFKQETVYGNLWEDTGLWQDRLINERMNEWMNEYWMNEWMMNILEF